MSDERPLLAGVCGDPIGHSKSPVLFRHWFDAYEVAGHYVPLLIRSDGFETAIRGLIAAGFRGVNVTIPHKGAALEIADEVSDAARSIGAANTLTFSGGGQIHADNTDGFGFIENLRADAPDSAHLSQALHHARHPQTAVKEAFRILKPGGQLIIIDLMEHGRVIAGNMAEVRDATDAALRQSWQIQT